MPWFDLQFLWVKKPIMITVIALFVIIPSYLKINQNMPQFIAELDERIAVNVNF